MSTKLLFYYLASKADPTTLYRAGKAFGDEAPRYTHYLAQILSGIAMDSEDCDFYLDFIHEIESGKREEVETGGNDIELVIKRDSVQVSILVSDDWTDQPEGVFTLEEVKKALLGWKEFLSLPESSESRVEVEL